jgi:pilus assembly protein FimV
LQSAGTSSATAVAPNPAPVDLSHTDNAKWQEMATKLDLASAYEEIGDKEGAKELLNEVIKDGDSGQQQKARLMLSKI